MRPDQLPERDLFGARTHEYILPEHAYHTVCKSCGAPMAFIKTPAGKALPLSLRTAETRDGVTYGLAHFADCPQAKEWSKR